MYCIINCFKCDEECSFNCYEWLKSEMEIRVKEGNLTRGNGK
jgi:hypothetical protein